MAFETAYYVARSGTAARAVTAPDAVVPSAATIQAGIDTVPVGSGFCVRVFPESGGRWPVDLTEYRPGLAPVVYRQSVTTASVDGRILIAGVTAR